MIETYGAFLEVHVATSLEECERRDRKGLYKLAREGKIKEFTGISDPYEAPKNPELRLRDRGQRDRLLRAAGDPEAGEHGPDQGLTRRGRTIPAGSAPRGFPFVPKVNAAQSHAHRMHNACTFHAPVCAAGAKG